MAHLANTISCLGVTVRVYTRSDSPGIVSVDLHISRDSQTHTLRLTAEEASGLSEELYRAFRAATTKG